jgi:hypothetical protein
MADAVRRHDPAVLHEKPQHTGIQLDQKLPNGAPSRRCFRELYCEVHMKSTSLLMLEWEATSRLQVNRSLLDNKPCPDDASDLKPDRLPQADSREGPAFGGCHLG